MQLIAIYFVERQNKQFIHTDITFASVAGPEDIQLASLGVRFYFLVAIHGLSHVIHDN